MTRMIRVLPLLSLLACTGGDDTGAGDDTSAQVDLPLAGWGTLSGDCDVLDTELTDGAPSLFQAAIDLPGQPTEADLTDGGAQMYADGNLGGSSLWSEVFAYEVLARCEQATMLKSEAEIAYDTDGKKTDLLVEVDGLKIGVSVVRAFQYPAGSEYTVETATDVIGGKLSDILESSANVSAADAWEKQVLAVLAWDADAAASVATAWSGLDASVKADTIVWVTTTDGDDEWVYLNQ